MAYQNPPGTMVPHLASRSFSSRVDRGKPSANPKRPLQTLLFRTIPPGAFGMATVYSVLYSRVWYVMVEQDSERPADLYFKGVGF